MNKEENAIYVITRFFKAEANLNEEQERLRTLLESAIYIASAQGDISKTNIREKFHEKTDAFRALEDEYTETFYLFLGADVPETMRSFVTHCKRHEWANHLKWFRDCQRDMLAEIEQVYQGKHPIQLQNKSQKGWFR